MLGNFQLRKLLDQIVSEENSENWWCPHLFQQNTVGILPKELKIREFPPEESRNYNCFVYAFGLQNRTEFLGPSGWEYTRNLHVLVDNLTREKVLTLTPSPISGALVTYRTDTGQISHVGIMAMPDIVLSKWSWGPLLEHSVYAVPASYGDWVEFYIGRDQGREVILKDFFQSRVL